MKFQEIPFAVLRLQYQIARLPLQLIEEQLAARLAAEAPARLFYERSLGALDVTVGNLLDVPELRRQGTALVKRSSILSEAAHLDATATRNREQADTKLEDARDEVVTDLTEARDATEQQVVEARTEADQRKREADAAAEKRTAAAEKEADKAVAQRQKSAAAVKRQREAQVRAVEQAATVAAESKLKDAQAKRSAAASKRAQADQVDELADVEKAKRRSERANSS